MKQTEYPAGWDKKRVQAVLTHYENQNEDEAAEEDETVLADPSQVFVKIPFELMPQVRDLLARYNQTKRAA